MHSVVPSLPAASFSELAALADSLRGVAPELQIDIVDGRFVPAISWPFTEPDPITELERLTPLCKDFALEIDCMVLRPEQYLDTLVEIGVRRVVVHMGSTDAYDEIIDHARTHGYAIGLAFTNDVPLTNVEHYIDRIDFVQVMGIAEVGKQGQPFDARTIATVRSLRAAHPALEIAVDGSVNADTMQTLKEAGVNRFAPGSAVAKQDDPKVAFLHLQTLVA